MPSRPVVTLLVFLAFAGCRSSDVPRYATQVESLSEHTFIVRLESSNRFTDAEFVGALLTEAARTAIDRGAVFLRLEALSANASTDVHPANVAGVPPRVPDVGNPDISDPEKNDPMVGAGIAVARNRRGSVRFTVSREALGGTNVFEASALLERVKRGDAPKLQF